MKAQPALNSLTWQEGRDASHTEHTTVCHLGEHFVIILMVFSSLQTPWGAQLEDSTLHGFKKLSALRMSTVTPGIQAAPAGRLPETPFGHWTVEGKQSTSRLGSRLNGQTLNQLHRCYEPKTSAHVMQRPGSPASHTPHCLALRDGEEPADQTTPRPRGRRNTPNALLLLCSSGTTPSGIPATALSPPAPRFTPSLTPWVVCAAFPAAWFYSACALHTGTGQQVNEGLTINPEI